MGVGFTYDEYFVVVKLNLRRILRGGQELSSLCIELSGSFSLDFTHVYITGIIHVIRNTSASIFRHK